MSYIKSAYRVHLFDSNGDLIKIKKLSVFPTLADLQSIEPETCYAIVKGFNRSHEIAPQLIHKNYCPKTINNIVD